MPAFKTTDGRQIHVLSSDGKVWIDVQRKEQYGGNLVSDVSVKTAREIAKYILATTEEPKAPTAFEIAWPQVKVGDEFGFGTAGASFPYKKLSETTYGSGNYVSDISRLTPGDHACGLSWRTPEPPKPTVAEQIKALPDGTLFYDNPAGPFIKLSATKIFGRETQKVYAKPFSDDYVTRDFELATREIEVGK